MGETSMIQIFKDGQTINWVQAERICPILYFSGQSLKSNFYKADTSVERKLFMVAVVLREITIYA